MIEIKTLSLFPENPQNNDEIPHFQNSLTQQIQQFLSTANCYLKEPETKKIKKQQRNRDNSHHTPATSPKTTKSTDAHDWGYKWGCPSKDKTK